MVSVRRPVLIQEENLPMKEEYGVLLRGWIQNALSHASNTKH